MIKKLLNIYDEDLYLSIQVHAKKHKSDANAFINKAMEEKAARDGVEIIKAGNAPEPINKVDEPIDEITKVDFEDDKTF